PHPVRVGREISCVLPPRASHGAWMEKDCAAGAGSRRSAGPGHQRPQLADGLSDGVLLAVRDRQTGLWRMAGGLAAARRRRSFRVGDFLGPVTPWLAIAFGSGSGRGERPGICLMA